MKKEHIKRAQLVVSKLPEPKLEKCYVMFCPETGEFYVDINPTSGGEMRLSATTDMNFAFRAQTNPDAFCELAKRISDFSGKKWRVIQCHTTCIPKGLFLPKEERK